MTYLRLQLANVSRALIQRSAEFGEAAWSGDGLSEVIVSHLPRQLATPLRVSMHRIASQTPQP